MGYQLVFWHQGDDAPAPLDVYEALMGGADVPSLHPLPITSILVALSDAFPGTELSSDSNVKQPVFWQHDKGTTVVELSWSDVHVSTELRPFGRFSGEIANGVIDVLRTFGCPVYDPQTGERFTV